MTFRDLDQFFEDNLKLPIGGKVYVVPPVSAKTGLAFQRMLGLGVTAANGGTVNPDDMTKIDLDDDGEIDLYARALGTAYDEMLADKVPWPRLRHAGITAFMWAAGNRQLAEETWNTPEGGPGKARKQPQDRKPKKATR